MTLSLTCECLVAKCQITISVGCQVRSRSSSGCLHRGPLFKPELQYQLQLDGLALLLAQFRMSLITCCSERIRDDVNSRAAQLLVRLSLNQCFLSLAPAHEQVMVGDGAIGQGA